MLVPKHLSDCQKTARMGVWLPNLLRYANEGTDFAAMIVACNKTWYHHFDPAAKRMSTEWRHPSSPRPKKKKLALLRKPENYAQFLFRRQKDLYLSSG